MSTVDNNTKYDRPEAMVLIGDTRPASSCLWFIIAVKQTQTIESEFLWLLCEGTASVYGSYVSHYVSFNEQVSTVFTAKLLQLIMIIMLSRSV